MKSRPLALLLIIMCMGVHVPSYAADYYCDPVGGSMVNDGSEGSPWASLEQVFLSGKTFNAGDVLFLMNGPHGQSRIGSATQTDYVTILPYPGHTPKIACIRVHAGTHWAFEDLTFTTDGSGGTFTRAYMFETLATISHIKMERCIFYSIPDSSAWTKADWDAYAEKGIFIRGDHTVINSNTIMNTSFALEIRGDYAEVKGNLIDNFSGDALRALGSHAVYDGNVIRDAYVQDYAVNHDDAIQLYPITNGAFDPNGVIEDVVFRNNRIYSFADPITQDMIDDNLVGYWMQSFFHGDGHGENIVIENNLIVSDHYHGITLSGPLNCRVQNNTVVKTATPLNPDSGSNIPGIHLVNSKQGGYIPTDSTIRNNIASAYSYSGTGLTIENNLQPAVGSYSDYFVDNANYDFRLKTGSPGFNAGSNANLTATDLAGKARKVGTYVDCGALEYQPYEVWISGYPGVGTATNRTDNPDNDALNNLYEWGLGGNPDDPADVGLVPSTGIIERSGDAWLEYIYAKRNDADDLGLTYYVERNTSLTNTPAWTLNDDWAEGAPDSAAPGYSSVSNWVDTIPEDAQFLRLMIEAD